VPNESSSPDEVAVFTLHRYFIWANRLRDSLLDTIEAQGPCPDTHPEMSEEEREATEMQARSWFLPVFFFGSYWLASLYVVVEGWQEIGLDDPEVSKLLDEEFLQRLRRHRNAVLHYQPKYLDRRVETMFTENSGSWIGQARSLHDALSRFFLEWFLNRSGNTADP
jgi:hypothetical protein